MIEHLYIENVALIEKADVSFSESLNIISGETGAGKSILLSCISFVFGGRVTRDFIRKGQTKADVRAVIIVKSDFIKSELEQLGIACDDDCILINRIYNNKGKNICRVNGKLINIGFLKELSKLFIDIHSQHQHQSLLEQSKHIELLDSFCGAELEELKSDLKIEYLSLKKINEKYENLSTNTREKEIKIDILKYQINEIENFELIVGEDITLLEQQKKLSSGEKIEKNINKSIYNFSTENGVLDNLNEISVFLDNISNIDDECMNFSINANNILELSNDLVSDLRNYYEGLDFNINVLEEIEERLNDIQKLKKKYGNDITEILQFVHNCKEELAEIDLSDESIKKLKEEVYNKKIQCFRIAENITKLRLKKSIEIEKKIEDNLKDLGMKDIQFKININKKNELSENGMDKVVFYISTNKGEDLKELDKVASGGEMSRVMLGLKNVIADIDVINTFIFDEIDTGVSGITAQKVANKMKELSKTKQIISITHLPQIASAGDKHIYVEKSVKDDNTYSNVYELDENEVIGEIARLFGGENITNKTLEVAKELIKSNK